MSPSDADDDTAIERTRSSQEDVSIRRESLRQASVSDQPTSVDALGFAPYVDAISRFLLSKETSPPLSLSIEGDWGSGKSSFMKQLRQKIQFTSAAESAGSATSKVVTVWFNAWRHDKGEALWAAFALDFIDQISKSMTWFQRIRAAIRLMQQRYDWSTGWWDALRAGCKLMLWVALAGLLLTFTYFGVGPLVQFLTRSGVADKAAFPLQVIFGASGIFGFLASAAYVAKQTTGIIGNPLRTELKKHLRMIDYTEKVAFIEKFHRDFSRIIKAYANNSRVYVFVDDLDRCEVATAAELLQALNLMIADDAPMIFILGIDRLKVAAGLAVRSEKILPYLNLDDAATTPMAGLEYGLMFIDKFVQLPFKVPRPGKAELRVFLNSLRGHKAPAVDVPAVASETSPHVLGRSMPGESPTPSVGASLSEHDDVEGEVHNNASRWHGFELEVANDSDTVQEIVELVAPVFDYNPRRLKQFINAFRLKAYICFDTGLFNPVVGDGSVTPLSFEALGKFVALTLRWPMLVDVLTLHPDFFVKFVAGRRDASDYKYWYSRPGFMALVVAKTGLADENSAEMTRMYGRRYDLQRLDVAALLVTSPRVALDLSERTVAPGGSAEMVSLRSEAGEIVDGSFRVIKGAGKRTRDHSNWRGRAGKRGSK